ncbi:histidine kinase [Mucilaginibacter sp. SMC90]|uniref:sensor histidine kinase n=1 Tax=Mucilaginibacter sp. SMC90 TaxID=2929803 RepID=UPI001FB3C61E|nr:histidine kinase [Mucilaginibacter sp. SMC90]UOE52502.1 histidine kinase [Mucilaginibacter sp. SMC90]
MQQIPFIYSNSAKWRISRHFSFWLLWFLFQLLLYSFSPSPALQRQTFLHRLLITSPETLMYLIPSMFLAYTLMYLVIPKLVLPGKYAWATLSAAVLVFLIAALSATLSMTVIDYLRHLNADKISPVVAHEPHPAFYVQFGVAMLAGLRGSITVGGVAAAIKLMKCFYERQQAALMLEKEKASAELQMLKAQLHPHFLFNTLNNIYSFTQEVSEKASGMIMGLSQLLRYILYDCSKPLVPIDQELKMIQDYFKLESARYDQNLDLSVQMPKFTDHLIAPLMLLPFIENAFKHGASQVTEHPWISLTVSVNNNELSVKLINGKPIISKNIAPGIGIANVRKRLELLYPGQHELEINDEEEMYIVNLRITLATGPVEAVKTVYHGTDQEIQLPHR